jgi:NhaP-type Na+/H+ or K+/H+ antiporter
VRGGSKQLERKRDETMTKVLSLTVALPVHPVRPILLNMTFAVVVLSIVVQGPTIRRLFTHEELNRLLRS